VAAVLVYVTAPSLAEAEGLARLAVESRLAACANILPGMRSLYWWQGRLEHGEETVLLLKTTETLAPALTARLTEAHSYGCPCVVTLPVTGGNPDFIRWIDDETGGQPAEK
jgi:periplasmic divalent cation tolerance protein